MGEGATEVFENYKETQLSRNPPAAPAAAAAAAAARGLFAMHADPYVIDILIQRGPPIQRRRRQRGREGPPAAAAATATAAATAAAAGTATGWSFTRRQGVASVRR